LKRFLVGTAIVVAGAVPFASSAWASSPARPTITPTVATFTIPNRTSAGTVWTLNLWAHGTLVGTTSGTSGTLVVNVPATSDCKFQADALKTTRSGQKTFVAGSGAVVPGCGGGVPG